MATIKDNLISYWRLDEPIGEVIDIHGNNNGVNNGATRNVLGKINKAFDFNGSSDYVKINSAIVTNPSSLTISSWFKKESGGATYECVLHHASANTIGSSSYWMGVDNSDYLTATIGATTGVGWAAGKTTTKATYGEWYLLTATWDGSVVKVYINGEYNKEYNLNSYTSFTTSTRIGGSSDGGASYNYFFKGKIDEVGIWNRALSPTEITKLYNSGKGLNYPFTSTQHKNNHLIFR